MEHKKILIVEDSEIQLVLLKRLLEENGYDVETAKNGSEGLAKVHKLRPDLVISDILMPVMDGYQMCGEIKNNPELKDIPVMLLTQLADPEDVIKGLNAKADTYVTKPYDPEYLISKIRGLFEYPTQFVNNVKEKCVEVIYNNKKYMVKSSRTQTISMLLATYENEIIQNRELQRTQEELKLLNEKLEDRVKERTAELTAEIGERKRAEQELRESEERFKAVFETANDAVICMDSGGYIYLWNRKAEEMFGFSAAEAIGMELHGMIVPEKYRDKAREGKKLFHESGAGPLVGKTIEALGLRKDGTEFPIELSISAMKIKEAWHATGIIRDITAREQAKKELQDRLEELELFHKATIQRELNIKDLRNRIKGIEGNK